MARTIQGLPCSIDSFGYGGANSHAIIDAADAFLSPSHPSSSLLANGTMINGTVKTCHQIEESRDKFVMFFSAHSKPTLVQNIRAIARVAHRYDIESLAYTLSTRRSKLVNRAFAIVDRNSMSDGLREEVMTFGAKARWPRGLAFAFTGEHKKSQHVSLPIHLIFGRA